MLPGAVSADMRRAAKVINFGIIYGMGPQRLARELGIPLAEAQRYIASYFARYAGVRAYMDGGAWPRPASAGYVTTILGRRRSFPELRSRDRGVAQAAERVAANTPIQGSAADLIKMAMVAIERRLLREGLRGGMILQVHDELVFEVAEDDRETGHGGRPGGDGGGHVRWRFPCRSTSGVGRNWAEAH